MQPQLAHRLVAAVTSTTKTSDRDPASAFPSTYPAWVPSASVPPTSTDPISTSTVAEALGTYSLRCMSQEHQVGSRLLDERRRPC